MDKPVLYPWLKPTWLRLRQHHQQGKLAHAYLLSGMSGLGKVALAEFLAHAVLCPKVSDAGACGVCKVCRLLAAQTLPDIHILTLEGASQQIKIDQVRKLCQQLTLTSQIAARQVAIIYPAEQMNQASANSLLKTLEEPTEDTLLILVTDYPSRLLPTIRSRCQHLHLKPPAPDAALVWLQTQQVEYAETLLALTSGAPLAALRDSQSDYLAQRQLVFKDFLALLAGRANVLSLSDSWQKSFAPNCFYWLQSWVEDMIRLKLTEFPPTLVNQDVVADLKAVVNRLDLKTLYAHLSLLQKAIQLAPTTVNSQMLMDEVLYPWDQGMTPSSK